ncbi:hypothetical protein MTO96_039719 [Rhipicephalus appendiculatus]
MLADSVVVFASDNGAAPVEEITAANAGSNWPLRGVKGNVWEGGVRTPAVFWYGRLSGGFPRPPSQQMMHIVDWAPTFYAAAGTSSLTVRSLGLTHCSTVDGPPPEGSPPEELDLDALVESSDAWRALQQALLDIGNSDHSVVRKNWRQELIVKCSDNAISEGDQRVTDNFDPHDTAFLFDVFNDPCELNNLASTEPELRNRLLNKLSTYRAHLPSNRVSHERDERGYPEIHDCMWSTWLDVEPAEYRNCPC